MWWSLLEVGSDWDVWLSYTDTPIGWRITYPKHFGYEYAPDVFPAVQKNRYVLAWIHVSDTFGPHGIRPKPTVSPITHPRSDFRRLVPPPPWPNSSRRNPRLVVLPFLPPARPRRPLDPLAAGRRRAPSPAKIGRRRGPPFKTSKFFPHWTATPRPSPCFAPYALVFSALNWIPLFSFLFLLDGTQWWTCCNRTRRAATEEESLVEACCAFREG